jgi:copper/silver efflux system protein
MIEKLIEVCARNKGFVFLGTAFAVFAAVYSLRQIPLDAIPDLSDPQVIIFTEWMGRSPDLVEDQVTYPITSSLLAAPHVTAVRGLSMFGMSFIYVLFEEGTDLYWARTRVLEYLNSLQGRLPKGVTPVLGPDATSIGWAFQYALVDRSGHQNLADLRTFQDFNLRYALASVPGVAEVASVGGYQRQYQVEVDPDRLRAYDLTLADVSAAIRRSNNDVGGRIIEMSGREYFVRGRGYVQNLDDLRRIALGTGPGGTPLRLDAVARVSFGPDIRRGFAELDGDGEAVGGTVIVRYGENTQDVVHRVKQKLEELKKMGNFPEGVDYEIVYDRSGLIERAIETLKHALLEEGIVVAVVIFVFLLHFRSTLVPIAILPIAVLLAFIPMHLLGMSSNIMSLGGIAIAIGAMVDAAIVLVENAHKHLEKLPPGGDRTTAIIQAAKEVGPPIFFSLLIITTAFLPVFTLVGQAGRLFKPLAYTKTFAMAMAAVLSVTLAPALMVLLIRGRMHHEKNHPVSRLLIGVYKPFVYVALRNPKTTIALGIAALISAVPLAMHLGSEFMPPLNEGDALYMPTTFPNLSIEEAKRVVQVQDRILKQFPEVEAVLGKAGRSETATDPAPLSMVETVVKLRPVSEWRKVTQKRWYSWMPSALKRPLRALWPEERPLSWAELTNQFDAAMKLPGWTNAWTMPIKTRVDMLTTGVRTPIGVKIFGTDLQEIEKIGIALENVLSKVPFTRSVYSDRSTGGFYIDIIPDREAITRYGLTVGDVEDVIESAVGGMPIEVTIEGRKRFTINVRYPRDLRDSLQRLREVTVPVRPGGAGNSMSRAQEQAAADLYAQAMGSMGSSGSSSSESAAALPSMPGEIRDIATDAAPAGSPSEAPSNDGVGGSFPQIPLGQLAEIKVTTGPPMIRSEAGLMVGYVYVDMDTAKQDIGSYVNEAKKAVAAAIASGDLKLPSGFYLKWTGQYELLEQMAERMKIVVPITFLIIVILLYLQFRNFIEVLIVLLSIPFALVGSVWLMAALDYNLSTAVWVGIIALVGLAAQTGIVMIVYIDNAYERRLKAGKIRDLNDIIWAHMEGTVLRVRPKLMTVSTMAFGLIPLLWASGSGADVMKRIAAPMVGGLATSAFLTLEIIPVIYTYWRYAQLKKRLRAEARARPDTPDPVGPS